MNNAIDLMIVDDNVRARQALTTYLSLQSKIRIVAQAANGVDAIKMIQNCLPDVVVMDLLMPGMDGLEATRIIKTRWPMIKIIILTMYPNYRSEASAAGADAFLVKGCAGNEMIATILNLANKEMTVTRDEAWGHFTDRKLSTI